MKTIAHSLILFYTYGVARVGYSRQAKAALLFLIVFSGNHALANTLHLGAPRVENDVYAFPVMLQGSQASIAALDFRFAYDPSVFRPAGVHAGVRAEQANKLVSGNVSGPGDFRVVIMGLNQSAMENGEIAWISLERIGDASGAVIRIDEAAFATPDGEPLGGQGDMLQLPGERPESDGPPEEDGPETDAEDDAPASVPERDEDDMSPALRRSLAELPEAMRATVAEGAEIDGWDALAMDAEAPDRIEIDPSAGPEQGVAEWVAIPVTRTARGDEDESPLSDANDRPADTLAQVETGPVTIESKTNDDSRESVQTSMDSSDHAAWSLGWLRVGLAVFAVLLGTAVVLAWRRFSA